jgi:hypothetical protein
VYLGLYQFSAPCEFSSDETGSVEFDRAGERVMLGVYEGRERYLFGQEGYQSVEVRPKWSRLKATYESGVSRYLEQRKGVVFLPMLPITTSK